jgi:hypothetical protein
MVMFAVYPACLHIRYLRLLFKARQLNEQIRGRFPSLAYKKLRTYLRDSTCQIQLVKLTYPFSCCVSQTPKYLWIWVNVTTRCSCEWR